MRIQIALLSVLILLHAGFALSADQAQKTVALKEDVPLTLDHIMSRIENRYNNMGFSADFVQESILKALDITDSATGKMMVKYPGMMRWEYEKPDKQIIVTDGKSLWVHRPEDNQVMIGAAPVFFGEGKGAGFLSDMTVLRKKFNITLEKTAPDGLIGLKLIPKKKAFDISAIYLFLSKKTFVITEIVTCNTYDDRTSIKLYHIAFTEDMNDTEFAFTLPEDVDILQLDESP
ncbi:MAG: outer membrane lipoprotein carrier protein LolA [Deltaproteobacteria bacterium]|nr:outer membrane lipoprotein carrier protein LolA [Deltaproteobacteria bacterium]